jgi:hypothetical protein
MESIFWLILGAALVIIDLILICVLIVKKKKGEIGLAAYWSFLLTFWGFWAMAGYAQHEPVNSKTFKITTEIRQKIIDGQIIKSDTLYKFTPKKK